MKRSTKDTNKQVVEDTKDVKEKKPAKDVIKKTPVKKPVKTPVKTHLRWKKITNGIHYFKGNTIRKGDILQCQVHELSDIVKRHFKCLDKIPEETDGGLTLEVQSLGGGKFNVVNPKTDKPINEKELTKTEAENIVGKPIEE